MPPHRGWAPPAPDDARAQLLMAHNRERALWRLAPLTWNARLEADAGQWAARLARLGALQHSSGGSGKGENLWMGTAGAYSARDMVAAFLDERRDFRPGIFPDVSRTGSWEDVGHYSQIIWPVTREVGCAIASGRQFDVLVCRYFPAGNYEHEPVGYAPN